MWSIGVTTYLLLSGVTPFNGKNRQQLFRRISCNDPPFPDEKWHNISYEAFDFVRKLLEKDPSKRLSANQALSHIWLRENDHVKSVQKSRQKSPSEQDRVVDAMNADLFARKSGASGVVGQSGEGKSSYGNETHPSPTIDHSVSSSNRFSSGGDRAKGHSPSSDRAEKRHGSREQTSTSSRGVPPPPPKVQTQKSLATRDRGGAVVNQNLHNTGNTADDVNARLLDVIKDQDAKIEKLERLVKQILEPEGSKIERRTHY
jgi:serine/threonine protein kinase